MATLYPLSPPRSPPSTSSPSLTASSTMPSNMAQYTQQQPQQQSRPAQSRRENSGNSSSTANANNRERRTSQISNGSSDSRRNSATMAQFAGAANAGRYPSPAPSSPASSPTHAQAQFAAFTTAGGPAPSSSSSTSTRRDSAGLAMLQGIEAQLQIPPFRGGPQAQRTHNTRSSVSGSSSGATSGAATPRTNIDQQQQQQQQQQQYYSSSSSRGGDASSAYPGNGNASQRAPTASRPSSTTVVPVQPHLQPIYPGNSNGGGNQFLYPHTPQLSQSARNPLPAGVVTSAATASSAATAHAAASRNRASHQIIPISAAQNHSSPPVAIALHTAAYQLPPGRQKLCFGDYQLLHTLGEGEFGKVKLGVHTERWGEEVAIKLIKKGSIETTSRSMKIQREIEVLKMVRHPHIVRLHEVVETDRYIGIVLEYASGGELFEYILAHKHLRENMACKLFAQLISGVAYLHSKKIVHRDLKLENLLLDRNRNIVITDFGFANRFNDMGNDLMQTSCGSPCYAAPELVLHDGHYVGSAVDVWSCGVILYAMLSGYLPYDDDPANPDGDNINLLYRYITTTQLSFPDWISPEPRELLLMMLVADPNKRCTLRDVMRHPWLRRYMPFFQNGVQELEQQAEAAYEEKRILLTRQQEHYFRSTGQAMPAHMQRSQSSAGALEQQQQQSISQQRHRSAMVHSVTAAQSMIPEFAPVMHVQQPRPSLPTNIPGPVASPPASSSASSKRAHAQSVIVTSAQPEMRFTDPFASSAAGGKQQQQQRIAETSQPASSAMQISASAPGDVETISDSLTSEGELRGEPRSRRTDDDDASTTSSSRAARNSTRANSNATSSTGSSGGDSKKRKGEEKRYTVQQMDYPVSPPAESTRSKTKARDSMPGASASPSLPASIAAHLGAVGEYPADPNMPILDAAAAAETIDVHMESPNASPARSNEGHSAQQPEESMLSAVLAAPLTVEPLSISTSIPIVAVPSISPVEEQSEIPLEAVSSASTVTTIPAVETPLAPRMTVPQPGSHITPPSSPKQAIPSPARTPKRSAAAASIAAAEALEASQRTPKASAQQQQPLQPQQQKLSSSPKSSIVPFPSPKQERRPSATPLGLDESGSSKDNVRPNTGTGSSGRSGAARHRKGMSTDKAFFSRLLGSSTTSVDKTDVSGEASRSRENSAAGSVRPTMPTTESLSNIDDLGTSRNRRRKALSLVVDPFNRSAGNPASAAAKNRRSARVQTAGSGPTSPILDPSGRGRSGTVTTQGTQGTQRSGNFSSSASAAQFPVSPSMTSVTANPSQSRQSLLPASHIPQPTYHIEPRQSKRVSDWFKWPKSSRDSVSHTSSGSISHIPAPVQQQQQQLPAQAQAEFKQPRPVSQAPPSAAPVTRSRQSTANQPTVVVTSAAPPAAQASTTQQPSVEQPSRPVERVVATPAEARQFAAASSNATAPRSTLTAQRSLRNKQTGVSQSSTDTIFDDSKMKVLSGATDKRCLTKMPPPQILDELKKTLQGMGMELERDGEYRWKAIRRSKKQAATMSGLASPSLALSPSPSSTFRSFFGRKNSATTSASLTGHSPSMPSPALTASSMTMDSLESAALSPTLSNTSVMQQQVQQPVYFGSKADSGGEVRFLVEIVRVRGLTGIYTLDFRRMKGSLSDYRENHDALLDRLTLGSAL